MRLLKIVSFAAVMAAVGTLWAAPISYVGGSYSQDFNGLPTSGSTTVLGTGPHDIQGQLGGAGVTGWTMSNYLGSSADTEYRAQDGSLSGSAGRGVLSLGTGASTERALGELPTSNQISRFGVAFTNSTGSTLKEFTLGFTGEQWRRGDVTAPINNQNKLVYEYAITSNVVHNINTFGIFTGLGSFSSPITTGAPTALDGNLPANQVPVSLSVNNINWAPGSTLMLRWSGSDESGQDDGLAIDNVSFSARVPEPSTVVMGIFAMIGVAGMLRRR